MSSTSAFDNNDASMRNNLKQENGAQDLLDEVTSVLVQASKGKRFLNNIIDSVLFYLLIAFIEEVFNVIWPEQMNTFVIDNNSQPFGSLLEGVLSSLLYAFYMGAIEAVTGGKSLGKLITGTQAVNEDGSRISSSTAFKRGFSRAVPFCAFSALGDPCYPWQDRWTNTYVIDLKATNLS